METTFKKPETKGILVTFALLSLSISSIAQESGNFFSKTYDNLTKGSNASFYIIAGVFSFGLIVFLISKIVAKYEKKDEKDEKNNIRHISHRHHHHHRVIKKSA